MKIELELPTIPDGEGISVLGAVVVYAVKLGDTPAGVRLRLEAKFITTSIVERKPGLEADIRRAALQVLS